MYKYFNILIFIIVIPSCSTRNLDTNRPSDSKPKDFQEWKLTKVIRANKNIEMNGSEIERPEIYRFYDNGTFEKIQLRYGKPLKASGNYKIRKDHGVLNYELDYTAYSEIIGNCTGENKETLSMKTTDKYLKSSWWACDGPGLFYEKLK